jgi:hypothetical protein
MNSPRVSTSNFTKNPVYRLRNFFTRRRRSTDPKLINNNKKRNRRGAMTYKNAARIRGAFQKPPVHPFRPKYVPPPPPPPRSAGPIYNNNNDPINPSNNFGSLRASQMNAYIRALRYN